MLKGGFIGLGRMGITHFSILNSHPLVKIVAVSDQSRHMLSILKKNTSVTPYFDYRKMINDEALDFVVISTPSDSHTEIVRAAIDNDLHTFVEKPFALTVTEGQKILAHLDGKKLINQVGYVNRFNEVFMEVKKLIKAGVIGTAKNFRSEMYGATLVKDSKASWRGKKKMGGGCMYEFASHCIDLAIYLVGLPSKVAGSVMESIFSLEVEDLVSSTFLYDSGYTGTIMVNWSDESYRKPTNIFTILGTEGKIIADKHAFKIYLRASNDVYGFHKGWNTKYITDIAQSVRFYVRGNEFTRQLDYFIDCIEQGKHENIASFEEALKTDIAMEEIAKDSYNIRKSGAMALQDTAELPQKKQRLINLRKFFRIKEKGDA